MPSQPKLLKIRWLLYFIVFIILPLRYKAHFVNDFFIYQISIQKYGALQSILHDSIIVFFILFFAYISLLIKSSKSIRYLLRTLSLCIFFIYVIDIFIIYNFSTHLTLTDVFNYGKYATKFLDQIYGLSGLILIAIAMLSASLISVDLDNLAIKNKREHFIFTSIFFIFLSAYCFRDTNRYIHAWMYNNFIEYNISILSQSAKYSEEFIKTIPTPKDTRLCHPKKTERKNIIILMVESLSSYQSSFFSGINNWTPNLDSIAKRNISFLNFYANGFNTEDGYIAVLTGLLPISSPSEYSDFGPISFRGFENITDSLPNIIKSNGYETYFLSSGDMMLSGEGQWAESIGFDYIEGSSHPYYDGLKRYHFNSVPDAALYERAMAIISQIGSNPYFMFISTLSNHPPFINPETDKISKEGVVRYVDKKIGLFYNKLKSEGFFKTGIMLITGDHRAMVPLSKTEIDTYGAIRAPAKIPLVISYGDTARYVERNCFQQTDIFNSIKNYLSDRKCVTEWLGDMINQPITPPAYIVFKRGDDRSLISIFYNKNNILVQLNGDRTDVIESADFDKNITNVIINKINYERMMRENSRITDSFHSSNIRYIWENQN